MLQSYIKIAWRSLQRNRLFSFINIFGLALSLSVCMIVLVRLKDQFGYDHFHPFPDRTYRIISEISNKRGDQWKLASTPLPLNGSLNSNSDIVERTVRVYPAGYPKASSDQNEVSIKTAFATPTFFSVFGFNLAFGNKETSLKEPNSIVLSNETALKFFGREDVLGKVVELERLGSFMITGILERSSNKSHLDFEAYLPDAAIPHLEMSGILPEKLESWDSFENSYTYVLLREQAPVDELDKVLARISRDVNKLSNDGQFRFAAEPLSAITPGDGNIYNGLGQGTSWTKVYVEVGVSFILLLAACFNYTNLTIGRALTRAKEVGIRKVAGAIRGQIFFQYILEAILVALFALLLAFIILLFILRYKPFNDGYEFVPDISIDLNLVAVFLIFTMFTGFVAGALPAWILSSFKPVTVLKNVSTQKLWGNFSLQKILIVFQFTLSLVIIIFLSTFYRQFTFIENSDYDFRTEGILTFSAPGRNQEILRNELMQVSGVEGIGAISTNLGKHPTGEISAVFDKSKSNSTKLNFYYADENIVDVLRLKVLKGRNFVQDGKNAGKYILINEKAVQALSFTDNSKAVDKKLWLNDTTEAEIVGVLKDFSYRGIGNPITPLAFIYQPQSSPVLNVAVNPAQSDAVSQKVSGLYKQLYPHTPFEYSWLNKYLQGLYDQTATYSLLGYLAFMAISIASLGLLGLVIYTVETRRKEVSVRKVIGASIGKLTTLLSMRFIKMLMIAGLIAMPIGYILSYFFLQNFTIRTPFGIGNVFVCFLFLLIIGLVTIVPQTYRASSENPVKNLRTE